MPSQYETGEKITLSLLTLAELSQACFSLKRVRSWVFSGVTNGCPLHLTWQYKNSYLRCVFCKLEQSVGIPCHPQSRKQCDHVQECREHPH